MSFKVETDYSRSYEPKPEIKPEPKPPVEKPFVNADAKRAEVNYLAANNKLKLQQKAASDRPTPYGALEEINNLPKPDPTDKNAVAVYKAERKKIADNAINNSEPPKLSDYSGLNGATRSYEYGEATQNYNTQISQLETISKEAENYPDTILSPGEAIFEINNLPRPDRNDPQAVLEYNNQRAEIADAALLYATPPKIEDFRNSGLNGATASYEYKEALTYYNASISELEDAAALAGTNILPAMTEAEIDQAATDYINNHNGVKNEDDAYGVGEDIAALAKTDPESATAIMNEIQQRLDSTSYGDNVASGYVNNSSIEDIRRLSNTADGQLMLEDLQSRLLSGSVHDNEYAEATKIDIALTGFDSGSLTGNPEEDAQTVDEQLRNLPADMREKYLQAVLEHPFGQEAIKYAGAMTPEGAQLLGETLGQLYENDPSGTTELLKQITDSPDASLYPYYYQSGLANAISKSGNDDLIESFAQNEINRAKSNPDEVRGYLNAATAYAGLSPEALQNVMETNSDFFKTIEEAGKLTGGEPMSGGFENGNIWEAGLGNLMERASQIKDANGDATPEAIKLFETVVEYAGLNFRTMEGLGAFFVEHAEQLIDKYTDPLNPDTPGSDVLESFFGNVVYSPIAETLQYKGGSLMEAIMGNDKGKGGVIGDVVQKYLDEANAVGDDAENDNLLGQRIGFLWSGLSKGFFKGVQNYKDKWNDDKEFRDFTFDMLGKGLGQIADKFALPGEIVSTPLSLVQNIMDAKAEDEREAQLDLFVTAFNDLNNAMFTRLNNYDVQNENVEGMNTGFTTAYSWEMVQKLLNDTITE